MFRIRQPDGLKISTAASISTEIAPTLIGCIEDSPSAAKPESPGFHPYWWAAGPWGQPGLAAPPGGKLAKLATLFLVFVENKQLAICKLANLANGSSS
jgi:hypothetical protein